jgi:phospholipase/lecithinase/hemolysin
VTDPCFNGTTVCANPAEYLFFDEFHPTSAAHQFIAAGFLTEVVPEPENLRDAARRSWLA